MTTPTPHDAAQMPALPVVRYHKADLNGLFVNDEECICENDVYTNSEDGEHIGVPLVRLSDAQAYAAERCQELEAKLAAAEKQIEDLNDEIQILCEQRDME